MFQRLRRSVAPLRGRARVRCALYALAAGVCLVSADASSQAPAATAKSAETIRFDMGLLNDQGLYGPPDGLRALHYEFCIPKRRACENEVRRIDPSAMVYPLSPGRIGCTENQSLVMGATHQPGFRTVLSRLAALPYVTRIEQSHFE